MSILKSRSKRISEEQARLNNKMGVPTTESTPVSPATGKTGDKKKERPQEETPLWNVVLAIAGIVVLCFLIFSFKNPSIAAVGIWARSHWFWILVLSGILISLIEINVEKKEVKKTLWTTLIVVLAIMFFIAPSAGRIVGLGSASSSNSGSQSKQIEKPILTMPANGDSSRISLPNGYAATFNGKGFVTHWVYADGHECIIGDSCEDGPILYAYVHDISGKPNSVTYEFVK